MRSFVFFLVIILLISALPFTPSNVRAVAPPSLPHHHTLWTLLFYLDGDNDLERSIIDELNKLEAVGSTNDVSIVAQLDRWDGFYDDTTHTYVGGGNRNGNWTPTDEGYGGGDDISNGNWTDTRRYFIPEGRQDNDITNITTPPWCLGEQNMGDPAVLQDFVDWGKTNFPADHYLLVLADHGHAVPPPVGDIGVCWDYGSFPSDTSSNSTLREKLTPSELASVDMSVDILAFDACQMAHVEEYNELAPSNVDIIVGSEETMHGIPWHWLNATGAVDYIINYPYASPSYFARKIIDKFRESHVSDPTLSAIDANSLYGITTALNDFSLALKNADASNHSQISTAVSSCQSFHYFKYGRDLYDFANLIYDGRNGDVPGAMIDEPSVRHVSFSLMAAINNATINEYHDTTVVSPPEYGYVNSHGIAICLPGTQNNISYSNFYNYHDTYYFDYSLSRENAWYDFLTQFYCGGDKNPPTITVNQNSYGFYSTDPRAVIDVDFASGLTEDNIDGDYNHSRLDYADYKVADGAWNRIFSSDIASYTSNWGISWNQLEEGENTISIRCADVAGNIAESSIVVKKDTTAPVIPSPPTEDSPDKDWSIGDYTIYWPAVEGDLSGISHYELQERVCLLYTSPSPRD